MLEYKILTERDRKLSGAFDVESLEAALNAYAAEGWRLADSAVVASIWKSAKTEIFLVLERPRAHAG